MLRFRSLNNKLIALYLSLIGLSLFALLSTLEIRHYRNQQTELKNELRQRVAIHETALIHSIWQFDLDQVGQLLKTIAVDPGVRGAIVYDSLGDVLAKSGDADPETADPASVIDTELNYASQFRVEPVGRLVLVLDRSDFDRRFTEELAADALIFAVLVAFALGITLVVTRKFMITPIRRLKDAIAGAPEDEIQKPAGWDTGDELGQLFHAYHEMRANHAAAEAELQNHKQHLEELVSERTAELKTHERLLNAIADNHHALIHVKTADGKYRMVNRAWCALFNFESLDVIGKTDHEIFPSEVAERARDSDFRVLHGGEPVSEELEIVSGGVEHTLSSLKFPLVEDQGAGCAICGIATDITDRMKLEKELKIARDSAERADRFKNDYLARISQEIRPGLDGLLGVTAQVLKTDLSEKQRGFLNRIRISTDALNTRISDRLDFPKIEAGRLEIETEAFDLYELLDDLGYLFAEPAAAKNLELVIHKSPKVPVSVFGDPLRLRQILTNLTENAVKFTERGSVVMSVKRAGHDLSGRTLQFSIQDTGKGLSTEKITQLFSSSGRPDSPSNGQFRTTGLGLVICRQLVTLMNGRIGANSRPGQGSNFWCEIPFDPVNALAERPDPARHRFRVNKFLVVDDNPMGLRVLREMLEEFGFECLTAASGEQALEILEKRQPDSPVDAVFLDWKLSGIDGIETARRIRSLESGKDCPIVMISASEQEFEYPACTEIGLNGFLNKPIRRSALFDILIRLFSERRQTTSSDPGHPESFDRPGQPAPSLKRPAEYDPPGFESIAGLNLREGIERLGNRPELYTRLLKTFVESTTNTGNLVRSQLSSGNLREAYRLLHRLESIAANLAATRLLDVTLELETVTRARMSGNPASVEAEQRSLDNFLSVLETTLCDVRKHLPSENPESQLPSSDQDHDSELPEKSAKETARRIRDATFMGDLSELHSIAESLPQDSYWALEVFRLTENFDFDGLEKLAYALDNLY